MYTGYLYVEEYQIIIIIANYYKNLSDTNIGYF